MLLEEFKNCMPERSAVYLNEQGVSTLQQAATLAHEFMLTHKNVFVKCDSFHCEPSQKSESGAEQCSLQSKVSKIMLLLP